MEDSMSDIKKTVTLMIPIRQWNAMRLEAANEKTSMASMIRGWIEKPVNELVKKHVTCPVDCDE
jgi:hypothetical protein